MKYNCPICGGEMYESNFCNLRSCRECQLSIDVKVLDATAARDARIAGLEKERDEARRDAKTVAVAANAMMNKIEHRDYRYAVAIMEKYK